MKKENFVMIMESIKKQQENDRKFEKNLAEFFDDFVGFYRNDLISNVIYFLEKEMNDKEEWIEYFIYELEWGKDWDKLCCKNEDGSIIDISTIEKLYDFLVENKK